MASGCSGCSASASSAAAIPYIGSKISLITNSELRYEGTLVNINTANSTVTLQDVRMSGTENRKAPQFVLPSPEMFDFIVFNGKDIKDLTVSEPSGFSIKEDPAVVAVNIPPHDFFRGQNQSRNSGGYAMLGKPMRYNNPSNNHGVSGGMMQQMQLQMHQQAYNNMMQQPSSRQREYGDQQRSNKNTYATNRNGGGVVGELSAQPNNSIKSQVAAAFDFEEANQKFVRNAEESATVITGGPVYDKKSSFFDNISCETLNRQRGRDSKTDRDKQRELDAETFGPTAAMSRGPRYFRRGQFPNARRSNNNGNRVPFGGNNQLPRAPYLYRIPPNNGGPNPQQQQPQPPYHHVRAQ